LRGKEVRGGITGSLAVFEFVAGDTHGAIGAWALGRKVFVALFAKVDALFDGTHFRQSVDDGGDEEGEADIFFGGEDAGAAIGIVGDRDSDVAHTHGCTPAGEV
jgi:hypothetical protein